MDGAEPRAAVLQLERRAAAAALPDRSLQHKRDLKQRRRPSKGWPDSIWMVPSVLALLVTACVLAHAIV